MAIRTHAVGHPPQSVFFHTPGELPLDAFTTFGVNVKPKTESPIGYFGTGLKYATSIVLREGGTIRLWVGDTEYVFYTSEKTFRETGFEQVRMKKRQGLNPWRSTPLPFTTQLGKTWEVWKAYRELMSNTIDEKGIVTTDPENPFPGGSTIEVAHPKFLDLHLEPGEIFLSDDNEILFENEKFQIVKGPSKFVYFRGIRVFDLRYSSRVTYNFKTGTVRLSEDRTAENIYLLMVYIKNAIQNEITDTELLRTMMKDTGIPSFETEEIFFDYDPANRGSESWRSVVSDLAATGTAGRAARMAHKLVSMLVPTKKSVSLEPEEWAVVKEALHRYDHQKATKILAKISHQLDPDWEVPF